MALLKDKFNTLHVSKTLNVPEGGLRIGAKGSETAVTATAAELNALDGITASVAELNITDGLLATADELNRAADLTGRIVSSTATTLTVTLASHADRVVLLASATTQNVVLPAASGTGAKYRFVVSALSTDGSKVIKVANTLDAMIGVCASHSTATNQVSSFLTSAASDSITFDSTTTGGIVGSQVEVIDIAANKFLVKVDAAASGTIATPFGSTVN